MELERLVRETVPDFMDLEVEWFIEERDGEEFTIAKVSGYHNDQKYGFEISDKENEGLPEEVVTASLQRQYRTLIETVIKDELQALEDEE